MAKYTKEKKQKAIDLYIRYCKQATKVIKELGYPNERHTLVSWYRGYEEKGEENESDADKRMKSLSEHTTIPKWSMNQTSVSSSRKSMTLILRMPLSSYQRLRMSWRTIIFGKESPVSVKGLFSVIAFSSVPKA